MKIEIINQSGQTIPRLFLKLWVERMSRLCIRELASSELKSERSLKNWRSKTLVLVFVGQKSMRQLNKEFRKKDYATDVLSFAASEPGVMGELVICPQVISRQAREHGLLVREELGYMILHGFLHLLGFDHEKSKKEAQRMFRLQDRLFEKLLVV